MVAFVSLVLVSIHWVDNTSEPFSILNNARPPLSEGKVTTAFSPSLYFSLSEAKMRILELSVSPDDGLFHQFL